MHQAFKDAGIAAKLDRKGAIGKRYAKHDEIGTPFCVTIDGESLEDGTVTVRHRDTAEQQRLSVEDAIRFGSIWIAGITHSYLLSFAVRSSAGRCQDPHPGRYLPG